MPFLAQEHVPIPTTDLLTWMFDNKTPYDEDTPIYIDAANPSRSISCRQARRIVRRLAAGFRRAGLRKGDCVCMLAFNDIYYSMLFLGVIAAGGVFAGTNPSYTTFELSHAIRTAAVKFLIVEPDLLPNAISAASETGIPKSRVFAFDVLGQHVPSELDVSSWKTLHEHDEELDWEQFDSLERSETTIVARLFSSGTTGMPKAINMSCYNFVSQHTLVMEYRPRQYEVRRLLCNPMFHVSQVPRAHTSPIRGGIVTHIMRRFELEPWLKNIEKYQITELNIVPMMVVMVLASGLLQRYSLKSLRHAWSGAAPLDKSLQARFKAHLREDTPFNQTWGMSETSCIATMIYPPEQDFTGSVGRFLPNCDAKLVDDDGKDVSADNVRGELCVRGPIIVPGYFQNEEANRRDWDEEGYFRTGDIASRDPENGKFYIVDRKKELIKVRGFQVAPAELEGVLLHHPSIIDAAVIGVQASKDESELPRAYVVLRPGAKLTEKEVREHSRQRLARYKNLDGGVVFVEAIAKNASGKILKGILRDRARREMGVKL